MANTNSWFEVLKDIGIFSIAAAFIKSILDNSATRKVEKFKQRLEHASKEHELILNTNLEKYKSDFSLHINRQNKLHDKRLEIIDELYKKLVTLDSAMKEMTSFMKPIIEDAEKEENGRVQRAQTAFAEYNNYFLYHKLYFSKEVCVLLETIRREYFNANWDYFEPKRLAEFTNGKPSPDGYREAMKTAHLAAMRVTNDIPKTLEMLENEFRKLIGV